jgi:molecular chaperone GrpE
MTEKPDNQNEIEESGAGEQLPDQDVQPEETPAEVPGAHDEREEPGKEVAQLKDQLLRKAAEFENYKKRTEGETLATIRFANEDLIMKLLPVLDDFERSLKALGLSLNGEGPDDGTGSGKPGQTKGREKKEDAFIHGVRLIYGKFRKILDQVGLKAFDSTGKPFDPGLHDALLQVPREDLEHHTVVEEIEKGYKLYDRVIRHARVIVSSNSGAAPDESDGVSKDSSTSDKKAD